MGRGGAFRGRLKLSCQHPPGDSNCPPYGIEKTGEDSYRITLAAAGFSPRSWSLTYQLNYQGWLQPS